MTLEFTGTPLRILDFDLECRPLSWFGGDWVTKEITAIAWKTIGTKGKPTCVALGECDYSDAGGHMEDMRSMLRIFCEAYDAHDMVTGHFIRGFDLPVINAALVELDMPLLGDKLTQDTKGDLVKFSGLSKSQENLGALLGLKAPKVSMNQATWREANRLTRAGIAQSRKRVIGDVKQHIEFRADLIRRGMLGRPKVWSSTPTAGGKYVP